MRLTILSALEGGESVTVAHATVRASRAGLTLLQWGDLSLVGIGKFDKAKRQRIYWKLTGGTVKPKSITGNDIFYFRQGADQMLNILASCFGHIRTYI
jgi:hypothetical protein